MPTRYPNGLSTGGKILKMGVSDVTGTLAVATGLTTIEGATLGLGEDPGTGAGDCHTLSYTISGGTLTIKVWQDDLTAASEVTTVGWQAWGV